MEITFKQNIASKVIWSDKDDQVLDGILNLIINRLKRTSESYDTIVINYPTTLEEIAIYHIAMKFCIISGKTLILQDNHLIRLFSKWSSPFAKRRLLFSKEDYNKMLYLAPTMVFFDRKRGNWQTVLTPLLFHDYKSMVGIAYFYGVPLSMIREDKYNCFNKCYSNSKVVHWDVI